jgi:hypothetical protein
MTYEERLNKVSRSLHASGTCYTPYRETIENLHWPAAAKRAIEMQADAIREAFEYLVGDRDIDPDTYLKQNGYIPEKEEQ